VSFRHPMFSPQKSRKQEIVRTRDLDATAVEIPVLGVRRHLIRNHVERERDIAPGRGHNPFRGESRGGEGPAEGDR
jgi:hypothetical protein